MKHAEDASESRTKASDIRLDREEEEEVHRGAGCPPPSPSPSLGDIVNPAPCVCSCSVTCFQCCTRKVVSRVTWCDVRCRLHHAAFIGFIHIRSSAAQRRLTQLRALFKGRKLVFWHTHSHRRCATVLILWGNTQKFLFSPHEAPGGGVDIYCHLNKPNNQLTNQ